MLRVTNLHKHFDGVPVLRGIDLDVQQHRVVALIGASGSGKSTLLRSINLLERIDDGQIFLKGEDISDPRIDVDRTRARIGVVFQQFNLFPHLTVLDNVTLASRKVHGIPRDQAEATGVEWLDRIGLGDKLRSYPDRLSGGQQQRVAIIRAIASDPELLLLDEITSALDPQLVGEVLELVAELKDGRVDDPDGHARDAVRAERRGHGRLPEGRRARRAGYAGSALRRSETSGHPRVSRARHPLNRGMAASCTRLGRW